MELPLYQIDAFEEGPFTGNPAAVVPLEEPMEERLMQRIAEENNLSETAFTAPIPEAGGSDAGGRGPAFALRWFTPTTEVDLCGHATLAAAAALRDMDALAGADRVHFSTRSGPLIAQLEEDGDVAIDLPAALPEAAPGTEQQGAIERALDAPVESVFLHRYALAVLPSEAHVRGLSPREDLLRSAGIPIIATAASEDPGLHFVSRFFAPTLGVPEDPVTGSAHCQLVPYWAARLGERELVARQVSSRGGRLRCRLEGDRVRLAGGARVYLRGTIEVG